MFLLELSDETPAGSAGNGPSTFRAAVAGLSESGSEVRSYGRLNTLFQVFKDRPELMSQAFSEDQWKVLRQLRRSR